MQYNQLLHYNMNNLFNDLTQLKIIDLKYNNLTDFYLCNQTLFYKLEKIDLSHNNISTINYNNWNTTRLSSNCRIDFSHNKITEFNVEDFFQYHSSRFSGPRMKLNLNENPIICDCNALKLVQYIKKEIGSHHIYRYLELDSIPIRCSTPNNLYNRHLRNLSTTELFCDIQKDCSKQCDCKQSTVNTIIFNCSTSNLQELPTLPKFDGHNSSKIELYAANNQIQSIQLINVPDNLTILDLRNNSLQTLTSNVIKRFESIDKLYLSINPWICDCSSVELVYFFHQYRSNIVDADDMMCADLQPFKILEATKLCVQLSHVIVVLLMGTSLLGLFSTVFVLFKKQIKIWLFAHNCCLGWISEEEADKDMIYDAFFVFSHHDNSFVTDLIIDLEEKAFKCCVHHRDWAAGEMIVTLVRIVYIP